MYVFHFGYKFLLRILELRIPSLSIKYIGTQCVGLTMWVLIVGLKWFNQLKKYFHFQNALVCDFFIFAFHSAYLLV